ncbi:hypothetical protein ACFXC8_52840 [Streptomyces sp. NPDC059441]|uniref:hypothetical protein n=1 Tax=Streptomyces sp. NPDC059441 TaxID=3346829 RepID=UPI00369BBE91
MTTNRARKQATRHRAAQENIPYSEARRQEAQEAGTDAGRAKLAECEAGVIAAKERHDRSMMEAAAQLAEACGLTDVQMTYFRLAVRFLIQADDPYNCGLIGARMTRQHVEDSMAKVRCADPAVMAAIRPVIEHMVEAHNSHARQ